MFAVVLAGEEECSVSSGEICADQGTSMIQHDISKHAQDAGEERKGFVNVNEDGKYWCGDAWVEKINIQGFETVFGSTTAKCCLASHVYESKDSVCAARRRDGKDVKKIKKSCQAVENGGYDYVCC